MEFKDLLLRRTVRRFRQEPLREEDLRAIIDAARKASCAANLQRLRYVVVTNPALVAEILPNTAFGMMVTPRRQPVQGVTSPVAYVAVCCNCEPAPALYSDAGAAIQSMEFAAWERGIGCCWLGSHKQPEVAKVLGLEHAERILFMIALGYPGENPVREDVTADASVKYYLDEADCIHVPKYTVDAITEWRR